MSKVLKLSQWNDLIDQVNQKRQNPPSGCTALPAINRLHGPVVWKKSEVKRVQDAIKALCPTITFPEIPKLWKQSILDDIKDALRNSWCNCNCSEDTDPTSEDGTQIILYSTTELDCVTDNGCLGTAIVDDTLFTLEDLVGGLQLGTNGIRDRVFSVFARFTPEVGDFSGFTVGSGIIACDGSATEVVTDHTVPAQLAHCGAFGGDCNSTQQDAINACRASVTTLQTMDVVLTIDAASAVLDCECDDV